MKIVFYNQQRPFFLSFSLCLFELFPFLFIKYLQTNGSITSILFVFWQIAENQFYYQVIVYIIYYVRIFLDNKRVTRYFLKGCYLSLFLLQYEKNASHQKNIHIGFQFNQLFIFTSNWRIVCVNTNSCLNTRFWRQLNKWGKSVDFSFVDSRH